MSSSSQAATRTRQVIGTQAYRAQVITISRPNAVSAFTPHPEAVAKMVAEGIRALTGRTNLASAWLSLVSTQDVVGIKVFSAPGPIGGTRPAVVEAVVHGLLEAGLSPKHIIVWDKHLGDLEQAGYGKLCTRWGVRLAGAAEEGYDPKVFYPSAILGKLVWGDLDFGREHKRSGRRSYVSRLVTQEITKIIHIPPLMNHNFAGVTGALYDLAMGSVDNTLRFQGDAARLATAVPEIYALPVISDRVALIIEDALICQYQGERKPMLHYSKALNQLWFSHDPVAVDTLAQRTLDRQRRLAGVPELDAPTDLYENAALMELGVHRWSDIRVLSLKPGP